MFKIQHLYPANTLFESKKVELRISSEINPPLHPVWICFLIEFGSMIADDWWWAKKMINFLCEFWFLFWQYGMFKLVFIWSIVENPRSAPFSKPIVLELWPKKWWNTVRGDTLQHFGGLRSKELGQAPMLLVFLFS